MKIAIVESVNGGWNYCPADALEFLGVTMQYSGDEGFPTAGECQAAALRDKSIPCPVRFVVIHAPKKD